MADITPQMAMAELARRELIKRQNMFQQQNMIQQQPNEKINIASIPEDIFNKGSNLVMGLGEKIMQLPDEASEAANQFYQHPLSTPVRASRNVLSSLLEGGKQLFNLPLNIDTYLGSKNIPFFKQLMPLAEKLKIGDTGLQKLALGEQQPGDQFWQDVGSVGQLFAAPETLGVKIPAVTSKGLIKQLSAEKASRLAQAKKDYSTLFNDAETQGINSVQPTEKILKNKQEIIDNSQEKYHDSLKKYLDDPTVENAHWAQSELGALERHFNQIDKRSGLTPSQINTYKAVTETRNALKKAMFSDNALGANPLLGMRYQNLAEKYKTDVIPYTSLEELSDVEAGKLRPKTAVKKLLSNEEFMINLSKRYPGLFLHTPTAKSIGLGTAGLLGYDELKKFLRNIGQ
jgi:hypothetical protein